MNINSTRQSGGKDERTNVMIAYLKSYEKMGKAKFEWVAALERGNHGQSSPAERGQGAERRREGGRSQVWASGSRKAGPTARPERSCPTLSKALVLSIKRGRAVVAARLMLWFWAYQQGEGRGPQPARW
jgi:hypothetical protein